MWCNTSIVIGSEAQFARVESFLPTSNNRNIAFSTNPTRANRTTLSLRYSRVLVHDVHLRALEDLIRSGQDCAFIFEDDVVPAPRTTHDRLRDLMSVSTVAAKTARVNRNSTEIISAKVVLWVERTIHLWH